MEERRLVSCSCVLKLSLARWGPSHLTGAWAGWLAAGPPCSLATDRLTVANALGCSLMPSAEERLCARVCALSLGTVTAGIAWASSWGGPHLESDPGRHNHHRVQSRFKVPGGIPHHCVTTTVRFQSVVEAGRLSYPRWGAHSGRIQTEAFRHSIAGIRDGALGPASNVWACWVV